MADSLTHILLRDHLVSGTLTAGSDITVSVEGARHKRRYLRR